MNKKQKETKEQLQKAAEVTTNNVAEEKTKKEQLSNNANVNNAQPKENSNSKQEKNNLRNSVLSENTNSNNTNSINNQNVVTESSKGNPANNELKLKESTDNKTLKNTESKSKATIAVPNKENKTESKNNKYNNNQTKTVADDKKTKPKEDAQSLAKRQEQVKEYEKYIEDSGLPVAFQLIFSEIVSKGINSDNFFNYTAMRLRQIGKEIDDIKTNKV
jgi:hypothetical protein